MKRFALFAGHPLDQHMSIKTAKCSCGNSNLRITPKGHLPPHMTPGGLPCLHRNVPPQRSKESPAMGTKLPTDKVRAQALNYAIQHTLALSERDGDSTFALQWLKDWAEGEPYAMKDLENWVKNDRTWK